MQKELADKVQEQKNNPKANPLATSLMVAGQAAIDEPNNPEHIGKAAEVVQALADQTQSSEHKGALNKIAKLLKGLYKAALEGVAVVGTIAAIATTGGGPIAVLVGAALLIVAAAGGAPGVLTAGLLLVGIGIGSLLVSKAIDAASEPFSNYYTGLFGNPNSNPVGGSH
ncbi:MAG TPA: hypothetical protein PLV25_04500 [Opitutales bacterium]|nr:hypothetical protein [Opitutales bacterium]